MSRELLHDALQDDKEGRSVFANTIRRCMSCGFRYVESPANASETCARYYLALTTDKEEDGYGKLIYRLPYPVRTMCTLPNGLVLVACCAGMAVLHPVTLEVVHEARSACVNDAAIYVHGDRQQPLRFRHALASAFNSILPRELLDILLAYVTYNTPSISP